MFRNHMIILILALGLFLNSFAVRSQDHSEYYYQKLSHFSALPVESDRIVFVGNSITDGAEWQELFPDVDIVNRGISGDVSKGVLERLSRINRQQPDKLFLMIGINDLARGVQRDTVIKNILAIADMVRLKSPFTMVYIQSLLPVNDTFNKFEKHVAQKEAIGYINTALQKAATEKEYMFINLYPHFLDHQGQLDTAYTNDGLHLTGEGYLLWKHLVYPYVYDLQERPSLIPVPTQLQWTNGRFPLHKVKRLTISEPSLKPMALQLLSYLPVKPPVLEEKNSRDEYLIHLQLKDNNTLPGREAYALRIEEEAILLEAGTLQGIFYGLQTLFQLMRDDTFIPSCTIYDQSAFAWRGLMHDLGRNYIPIDELKKHIDIMARYKLNALHLHLTEDIAWRLGIKQFPQLTAASNMQRNAGMYYTMEELKELISYCKARYITMVPEIDMPGHSKAFERAFGVGMQSEKGKNLLKKIVSQMAEELDVPYFHIGGDEVKITDTTFLPEISQLIRSYGKDVIGWLPGGNLDQQTIRQLWTGRPVPEKNMRSIDSRHLYLNHSDPLGGIVKMFNRQICDAKQGDSLLLGGEICIWPDRRPYDTRQIMLMNAVYPIMLTFAERVWQGGGYPEFSVNLAEEGSKQLNAFRAFENRLLDHKKQFFTGQEFAYVQQGQAKWRIAGPFDNQGDLLAAFEPETRAGFWQTSSSLQQVYGSTIWLRHFFPPNLSGHIKDPQENSTCYAYTEVYSPAEKEVNIWISFHNLSRSEKDNTAPQGEWDYKKSRIWLNGVIIEPPRWSKPGRSGEKEAPYIDESFEIRPPHTVTLKKGWNKILLKLPVGEFSTPHTRLVKWMFTVAFIENINGQWSNARGIKYK